MDKGQEVWICLTFTDSEEPDDIFVFSTKEKVEAWLNDQTEINHAQYFAQIVDRPGVTSDVLH